MTGTSLVGALPALVFAKNELHAIVLRKGITFQVADYGGLRTRADTTEILKYRDDDWKVAIKADPSLLQRTTKHEWRKIAPWGRSMHNYGAAFDVQIVGTPPGMSRLAAMNIVHDEAEGLGLRSGRDFGDPPHLELAFTDAPRGARALAAAREEWHKLNGTDIFQS